MKLSQMGIKDRLTANRWVGYTPPNKIELQMLKRKELAKKMKNPYKVQQV